MPAWWRICSTSTRSGPTGSGRSAPEGNAQSGRCGAVNTAGSAEVPGAEYPLNGPTSFAGRKVGALVTDGVDINLLTALQTALEEEGAMLEIVAPHVGGVEASDGSWITAAQKLGWRTLGALRRRGTVAI